MRSLSKGFKNIVSDRLKRKEQERMEEEKRDRESVVSLANSLIANDILAFTKMKREELMLNGSDDKNAVEISQNFNKLEMLILSDVFKSNDPDEVVKAIEKWINVAHYMSVESEIKNFNSAFAIQSVLKNLPIGGIIEKAQKAEVQILSKTATNKLSLLNVMFDPYSNLSNLQNVINSEKVSIPPLGMYYQKLIVASESLYPDLDKASAANARKEAIAKAIDPLINKVDLLRNPNYQSYQVNEAFNKELTNQLFEAKKPRNLPDKPTQEERTAYDINIKEYNEAIAPYKEQKKVYTEAGSSVIPKGSDAAYIRNKFKKTILKFVKAETTSQRLNKGKNKEFHNQLKQMQLDSANLSKSIRDKLKLLDDTGKLTVSDHNQLNKHLITVLTVTDQLLKLQNEVGKNISEKNIEQVNQLKKNLLEVSKSLGLGSELMSNPIYQQIIKEQQVNPAPNKPPTITRPTKTLESASVLKTETYDQTIQKVKSLESPDNVFLQTSLNYHNRMQSTLKEIDDLRLGRSQSDANKIRELESKIQKLDDDVLNLVVKESRESGAEKKLAAQQDSLRPSIAYLTTDYSVQLYDSLDINKVLYELKDRHPYYGHKTSDGMKIAYTQAKITEMMFSGMTEVERQSIITDINNARDLLEKYKNDKKELILSQLSPSEYEIIQKGCKAMGTILVNVENNTVVIHGNPTDITIANAKGLVQKVENTLQCRSNPVPEALLTLSKTSQQSEVDSTRLTTDPEYARKILQPIEKKINSQVEAADKRELACNLLKEISTTAGRAIKVDLEAIAEQSKQTPTKPSPDATSIVTQRLMATISDIHNKNLPKNDIIRAQLDRLNAIEIQLKSYENKEMNPAEKETHIKNLKSIIQEVRDIGETINKQLRTQASLTSTPVSPISTNHGNHYTTLSHKPKDVLERISSDVSAHILKLDNKNPLNTPTIDKLKKIQEDIETLKNNPNLKDEFRQTPMFIKKELVEIQKAFSNVLNSIHKNNNMQAEPAHPGQKVNH